MFDSHRGLINKDDIGVAALISRLTSPVSLEHPRDNNGDDTTSPLRQGNHGRKYKCAKTRRWWLPWRNLRGRYVLRKTAQSPAIAARVMVGTRDSEAEFRRIAMGGAPRKRERLPVAPMCASSPRRSGSGKNDSDKWYCRQFVDNECISCKITYVITCSTSILRQNRIPVNRNNEKKTHFRGTTRPFSNIVPHYTRSCFVPHTVKPRKYTLSQ